MLGIAKRSATEGLAPCFAFLLVDAVSQIFQNEAVAKYAEKPGKSRHSQNQARFSGSE